MFIDQLTIYAKAGDGGNGVVRWRHEKYKPMAGPSGGNGGNGGAIFLRAVRDVNLLSKYTGAKDFEAESGVEGSGNNCHGKNGDDLTIDVPVGSIVTDTQRGRVYELMHEGDVELVFKGGSGGFGNVHFKSPTNRSPEEATDGRPGEEGELLIELSLVVDVGLIGMPNAGKSTLLNNFTNAHSKIGSYPFTTTEPHLGDLHGYIVADIPGLIEGASDGKGLGHKFLRHVTHTKTVLHLVSLESEDAWERYYTIREELSSYGNGLEEKEEWIIFTKKDLCSEEYLKKIQKDIDKNMNRVFVISVETGEGVKELRDSLVQSLRK